MPAISSPAFLDLVYEAAFVPEMWPRVLHELAEAAGAAGSILFCLRGDSTLRWTCSEGVLALTREWFEGGWQHRTERAPRMLGLKYPGFITDLDVFSPEELDHQPEQVEFLRPRGYGWGGGTFIEIPGGDLAIFSIERHYAKGPIERDAIPALDSVRPHLARAALLSARLELERARGGVAALRQVGLPGAVLDSRGVALAANDLIDSLPEQISIGAFDRVHLASRGANEQLQQVIATRKGETAHRVRSIALPASAKSPAAVAHLVPICGRAHDIFSRAAFLLVVTRVARAAPPTASVLSGLFDLTPAEARIARAIADGASVRHIAASSGVSIETVRSQVKSVLGKVGVARQADLVALLGNASVEPGS